MFFRDVLSIIGQFDKPGLNDLHTMKSDAKYETLTPEATLRQIASESENAPELLKSIGVNPDQNFDKTLRQVCTEKQWNEAELLEWIKKQEKRAPESGMPGKNGSPDLSEEDDLTVICRYIDSELISRISYSTGPVKNRFNRAVKVYSTQHPWLKNVAADMRQLLKKLDDVVRFKRETFYPLAEEIQKQREKLLDGSVQKIKRSLKIVDEDHRRLSSLMKRIRKSANDFNVDENTCSAIRVLCSRLLQLFGHVEQHIELEKKSLLPCLQEKLDA